MQKTYDVIIIGGGPAGMIAGGKAGELGKSVLILEKNSSLGKKLLISGGGRCNVSNTNTDLKKIYKRAGKYLYSTYSQFSTEDTLNFFHERGMDTKVEEYGRMFPTTEKSQTVLDVLVKYMEDSKVEIKYDSSVLKIEKIKKVFHIHTADGIYKSKACIVATGGLSHPETGSTGDGFVWLKDLGHKIIDTDFSLVPIALKDSWTKQMPGLTLEDAKIYVYKGNERAISKRGRVLFTHVGISGPTILNMSKRVGELLKEGDVTIKIDMYPTQDIGALREKLNKILMENNNMSIKNILHKFLPKSLVNSTLEYCNIDPNTFNHSLKKEYRYMIVDFVKGMPLRVSHLLGADKAIISSGGVDINEVDFRTMESKIVPKLYLVGDVLDIDRPSGGYSLQLCWSTGYVAGIHC